MTDNVKKILEKYREKYERPPRTENVVFRVTPDERTLLIKVFGSMAGIRDFALASTDTNFLEDEDDTDQD